MKGQDNPARKPTGVSGKYEHIKESAQESGSYGERAKEVAAPTVIKKHKLKGQEKRSDPGRAPVRAAS
jgi:hypothetical protein